jgi:hypothetical protein
LYLLLLGLCYTLGRSKQLKEAFDAAAKGQAGANMDRTHISQPDAFINMLVGILEAFDFRANDISVGSHPSKQGELRKD